MKRLMMLLLALTLLAGIATVAMAANAWTKVGSSAFTTTAPGWISDANRLKLNPVIADNEGNIYAATCNGNNNGTNAGGITIFKTDGSIINVNLNALGFPGSVTQFVLCGDGVNNGDGKVYALQNWVEINWFNMAETSRILRVDSDGTVASVYSPGPAADTTKKNRLSGMAYNWDDGMIYFTQNGADGYWKIHYFWRFDPIGGTVEEAPHANVNEGWSQTQKMYVLTYTGNNYFAVIGGLSGANWGADAIAWDKTRTSSINGGASVGWGRDWLTAMAYDPARKMLWAGGRSAVKDNTYGYTNIMTRWEGNPNNVGLFTQLNTIFNQTEGIVRNVSWHANNNNPQDSHVNNGDKYWPNFMTVNPDTGSCWMSWSADAGYSYGDRGRIKIRGLLDYQYFDAGAPEAGADVMGLCFSKGAAYALTVNMTTGVYSLYKNAAPTEEPDPYSIVGMKSKAKIGDLVRSDAPKLVSYADSSGSPRYFYIQEDDRSCGIRVLPNDNSPLPNRGDRVTIAQGLLSAQNGELVLGGAGVSVDSSNNPDAKPLCMNIKSIGGTKLGNQPATDAGYGLNNVGLLVRVTGKVSAVVMDDITGFFWFTLDDGSGAQTKYQNGFGQTTIPGIKILSDAYLNVGDTVTVTGISTVENVYSTNQRLIIPRDFNDVFAF